MCLCFSLGSIPANPHTPPPIRARADAFKTPEYPQFFYVRALEITAKFAARLGFASDAAYYASLAKDARALYVAHFYNATSGCFAGCTYVSQLFALTLGLAGPQGSPSEAAAWARAMEWWAPNSTLGVPEHFGGGIISLKYAMPLLDAHGETGLALKMHLQTDRAPGMGYWIETGGCVVSHARPPPPPPARAPQSPPHTPYTQPGQQPFGRRGT